jgi:hypothetical protein
MPTGNSTDSNLISLGRVAKPTTPTITAAMKIGSITWVLVVIS